MQPVRTLLESLLFRVDRDGGRDLDNLYGKVGLRRIHVAERRQLRLALIADAADAWAKETGYSTSSIREAFAAGDGETPILDFLRDLIEQGKIQPFLEWLFENLPKLIAAIVAIFV